MTSNLKWETFLITDASILSEAKALGHIPVLPQEVIDLVPQKPQLKVLDGTFGRGGHAKLMDLHRDLAIYVAMDRDPRAIETAKAWSPVSCTVLPHDQTYSAMSEVAQAEKIEQFDVIFLDLGVSSPQLDEANRGFSFNQPGPLDMRMDPRKGNSAADLIAKCDETELADLIYKYGEERASRRIAKAIVQHRNISAINDTATLARIIESVLPRSGKIHPATRTFQGLRIAVNAEITELENALNQIPSLLAPGGRAIIISFHSLEDRPVKQAFSSWKKDGLGTVLTKKVIMAGSEECRVNVRSRSAKLRAFERSAS
jgi:16S rRNA (cytosine1402-N4)-methyltransferase